MLQGRSRTNGACQAGKPNTLFAIGTTASSATTAVAADEDRTDINLRAGKVEEAPCEARPHGEVHRPC